MAICKLLLLICIAFSANITAQDFTNPDLDGTVNGLSCLPTGWKNVPANFKYCEATDSGMSDTPDLADENGPDAAMGVFGIPYSGQTFVTGEYGLAKNYGTIYHEGIQQVVSGFVIGKVYSINFHQAVVKQVMCPDQTGSWAVYIDDELVLFSSISFSAIPPTSKYLEWESRVMFFTAKQSTYTISFLPHDNDHDITSQTTEGALRMGIDSIYIANIELEMPNVFTPNNDGYNDQFVPFKSKKLPEAIISIYDRWGTKVFESNELTPGWNGTYNNIPCSDGTYYWSISITLNVLGSTSYKKNYYSGYSSPINYYSGYVTLLK